MRFWLRILGALAFGAAIAPAQAADLAGSKDLPFLKRFQGSEIIWYLNLPYEELQIAAHDPKDSTKWIFAPSEGHITRVVYRVPSGHTVLEVLRNYEQAFRDAGFTQVDEFRGGTDFARDIGGDAFHQTWETIGDFNWTNLGRSGIMQAAYLTANGVIDGHPVKLALFLGNYNGPKDINYKTAQHFEADQPFVVVDAVTATQVVNQMVVVKAADMADQLASKGVVDLYGIYFDTDKTDLKPDSTPTLDEVANLLKIDRSLKLEISGHTDNTGDKAHNQKLSEGRASAVVKLLVTKYGIAASRLVAKGYGDTKPVAPNTTDDGRAKNRRVELKRI